MTDVAWKLPNFDVCDCGDYRHQHVNGEGRCKLGSLCTPAPCLKFRLTSIATEIPEPYRRVADWAASPEGKAQLEATAKAAKEASDKVLRDARVDPEQLRKPVTI